MTTAESSQSTTLPRWVPFAMFAGTTVALAIPLLIIRRQRPTQSPQATTAFAAVNFARSNLLGNKPSTNPPPLHLSRPDPNPTPSSEFTSPRPRELLSAISRVDYSTALYAGKAFGIATLIVTSSAFVVAWSVKTVMGIEDTRDFAHRTRKAIQAYLPSLVSSIHKSQVDHESEALASVGTEREWNAEHSEKRLQMAYEKGGFALWSRTALIEMEQELSVEREKREKNREA